MTDTPRTDEATKTTDWITGEYIVPASFARELERELAAVTAANHAFAELTKDTGDDSLSNVRRLRNELRIANEQLATERAARSDSLIAAITDIERLTKELTTAKAALEAIADSLVPHAYKVASEALAKIK